MKRALKIELYDAGVVLRLNDDGHQFEYTGWGYSFDSGYWSLTDMAADLMQQCFHLSEEAASKLKSNYNFPVLTRTYEHDFYCEQLEAKEKRTGQLRIKATLQDAHTKNPTPADNWHIDVSYRGKYTVYWAMK